MAAPMREGAPAGGARPAPHAHPANFEYDDNEWDIGIGDLIIDLDADIEKTDEAGGMAARAEPDAQRTALKMKIKRTKPGTKSSEAKHEIVKSNEMNGEPKASVPAQAAPPAAAKRGSGGHRRDKARDKHHHPHPPHDVNGGAPHGGGLKPPRHPMPIMPAHIHIFMLIRLQPLTHVLMVFVILSSVYSPASCYSKPVFLTGGPRTTDGPWRHTKWSAKLCFATLLYVIYLYFNGLINAHAGFRNILRNFGFES